VNERADGYDMETAMALAHVIAMSAAPVTATATATATDGKTQRDAEKLRRTRRTAGATDKKKRAKTG
jgi:hypothetical protein